eukprot:CAMPEP_0197670902 /NCGR_PEP_ID=MMETSP1338-20131121/75574_1 /TAXON_ID=43686 ORGANISM="Pelagodinium beii, Strain RCC1491" /NCGR_SAMPLE_ID=MMETSP1338 /ASSEMBLY_ACC=CAM_ASM_000754 /LENGTH=158 /DNA_ID=CAMNT_0043250705 /DNA_START=336 /DNA_END=810 /DNA_ORIENTATION=-
MTSPQLGQASLPAAQQRALESSLFHVGKLLCSGIIPFWETVRTNRTILASSDSGFEEFFTNWNSSIEALALKDIHKRTEMDRICVCQRAINVEQQGLNRAGAARVVLPSSTPRLLEQRLLTGLSFFKTMPSAKAEALWKLQGPARGGQEEEDGTFLSS